MIAVATASQKGGVGKTTVCINLAHALARRGWNVLVVDTDPQGGIGLSLSRSTRTRRGFYDFLMQGGDARPLILPTRLPELSVMPCGDSTTFLRHGGKLDRIPERLSELLRQLDLLRFDCVLLDTAAGLNGVSEIIVRGSEWVLIPQQAEPLAVRSIPLLLETLARFRAEGTRTRVAGILLTMVSSQLDASVKVAREVREMLPASLLFMQAIPRDPLFLEASAVGLPLSLIRKNPPQSALLFDQIAAELEDRIGLRAHKDQTHRHASLLD
ncbi:MAG TPA: ParA family protein [Verrucomicrobiaceae bacterium]